MICGNCGNQKAYRMQIGSGYEYCDRCGDVSTPSVPDIFWDGKAEHGLADDPTTGQPRRFSSKMEKARYLKERHLSEAGDRVHGAPASILRHERPQENAREVAKRALKHVQEMGAARRRENYMRILQETNRRRYG